MALSCNPTTLRALSKCFSCFTPNQLREILSYVRCQWALTKQVATFKIFSTGNILQNAGVVTMAHGLGQVPPIVIPVLVCVANDANTLYQVGDEIPFQASFAGNAAILGPSSIFVDGVNVYIHTGFLSLGNEANVVMYQRGGSATGIPVTNANFSLKVYCIVPTNGSSFTPADIANNTGAGSVAHGLGAVPNLVFPSYGAIANDAGLNTLIGMEQPIDLTAQNVGGLGGMSACRVSATQVLTNTAMFFAGNEANFDSWQRGAFNVVNPTSCNNFVLRARCFSVAPSLVKTFSTGSGAFTLAHGFSKTPQLIVPVIQCIANDAASGFSSGDEIPLGQVTNSGSAALVSNVAANSTNIIGNTALFQAGREGNTNIWQTKVSNVHPTSLNNFQLKIYAWAI